jgi:hypothetical protein
LKKQAILIVLVSIWSLSFGQKKEIYLNDDLIEITKTEFDKKLEEHSYKLRFELDTIIMNVKVIHIKKGKISAEELTNIKTTIFETTKKDMLIHSILVINYYPGKDPCNSGTANSNLIKRKYKWYLNEIKKMPYVDQFFIYKSNEGVERYGDDIKSYPDTNQLIETTFFPIHYSCGSYVIIDHEGNYYAVRGEYILEDIIDLLEESWHER